MSASVGEASRTGSRFFPSRSNDQAGPLSFEAGEGLSPPAPRTRHPVTAGSPSGKAKRPLDSARFSRRGSQRWMALSPSRPQGWP